MRIEDFSPNAVSPEDQTLIREVTANYVNLAKYLLNNNEIEGSAHKTAALRLLLESKMTLIQAITHP